MDIFYIIYNEEDIEEIYPKESIVVEEQIEAANIDEIQYVLPEGWNSVTENQTLFLTPQNDGGFIAIKVYDHNTTIGRRNYFCNITNYCIDGTTYFTESRIGNISGYVASAMDNSGGGPNYFGSKGDKFYIIEVFTPVLPNPSEFSTNSAKVFDSLVF